MVLGEIHILSRLFQFYEQKIQGFEISNDFKMIPNVVKNNMIPIKGKNFNLMERIQFPEMCSIRAKNLFTVDQ